MTANTDKISVEDKVSDTYRDLNRAKDHIKTAILAQRQYNPKSPRNDRLESIHKAILSALELTGDTRWEEEN
jgi:hypothetical protein